MVSIISSAAVSTALSFFLSRCGFNIEIQFTLLQRKTQQNQKEKQFLYPCYGLAGFVYCQVKSSVLMMRVYWTGYCHNERISAIQKLETAVQPFGFITDFRRFSDVAITVFIELPGNQLEQLYTELNSIMDMKEWEPDNNTPTKPCEIALEINFGAASGRLSIDTPAVPG